MEVCENWGYEKLAAYVRKESIDEMKHAEKLMERILYLDGAPNMTDYFKINIGGTVGPSRDDVPASRVRCGKTPQRWYSPLFGTERRRVARIA